MFDLHMHTSLSDGHVSVDDLLADITKNNLEKYAITDHNHCLAYNAFTPEEHPNLIIGTEITTSYQGYIVEVLGYHVNPAIINAWYEDFYQENNMRKNELHLFNKLKKIARKNGYVLSDDVHMPEIVKGISKKTIYTDLVEQNTDFPFPTYKAFFRQGLSIPTHDFFLNEAETYPELQDVIQIIHQAGGIAILAHPHEYGLEVKEREALYAHFKQLGGNGIEAFHPSASYRDALEILNYCGKNGMVSSGGSDFHRYDREVPIGVHLSAETVENPAFMWIYENQF